MDSKPSGMVMPAVSYQLAEAYSFSKQTHSIARRFLSQCDKQWAVLNIKGRLESETKLLPRAASLFEWVFSQRPTDVERFQRLILALSASSRARLLNDLKDWTKARTHRVKCGRADAAIPKLVKLAREQQSELRYRAISSLGSMGEGAVPGLISVLMENDQKVQILALIALSEVGPDAHQAIGSILSLLSHESDSIRREAVNALGAIGERARGALGALNRLTYDKNSLVKAAAVAAVDKIAYPRE